MRSYFAAAIFLAASIAAAPAVPVYIAGWRYAPAAVTAEKDGGAPAVTEADKPADTGRNAYTGTPYKVLDAASGEIYEVSERDYVIGAVCAEMPASFGVEALKAQAVAAHTYAERQRIRERSSPTDELRGADFSNDTGKYQGFFTREQAEKFFGESFGESYSKVCAAVDAVLPYLMTSSGEPIIAAFHSMSTGRTESAENAWGTAVDYLVPVDSSFDKSAPKYQEEQRFSRESLEYALNEAFPGIVLGEDTADWVKVLETSDSGTVLRAQAGDREVSGSELRKALTLRSPCFTVRCEGEGTVFTTRGYGHGVGMSQYGANSMAAEGKTWREILEHYYTGCEIVKN
jgi:stage II sporulation protein D